ncbi:MAG: hypothetical protein U9Q23_03500 [Candidatus Bipolaricaulota bacterium]|nr:hypothetical protein [Candidatus Bipolaricaulota bacterium]
MYSEMIGMVTAPMGMAASRIDLPLDKGTGGCPALPGSKEKIKVRLSALFVA